MNRSTFSISLLIALLWFSCTPAEQKSVESPNVAEQHEEAIADSKAAQYDSTRLILPGISIGKTLINEPMNTVVARMGEPDKGDAAMGKSLSIWYTDHDTTQNCISIFAAREMGVDDTSRVKQIRITSSWFVTKGGNHIGSELDSIGKEYSLEKQAHYKEKGISYIIYTSSQGIAFEVDTASLCSGIIVYGKGTELLGNYMPFHEKTKPL